MKPFSLLLSVLALSMAVSADAIERPTAPLRETVPGLRIETQAYPDHAATEWQFRLRAPEAGESPLYENLKAADFEVAFPANAAVMLGWLIKDLDQQKLTRLEFTVPVETLKRGENTVAIAVDRQGPFKKPVKVEKVELHLK
jgi:hypothetical protein